MKGEELDLAPDLGRAEELEALRDLIPAWYEAEHRALAALPVDMLDDPPQQAEIDRFPRLSVGVRKRLARRSRRAWGEGRRHRGRLERQSRQWADTVGQGGGGSRAAHPNATAVAAVAAATCPRLRGEAWQDVFQEELLDREVGLPRDLDGGARKGLKVGLELRRIDRRAHEHNLECWARRE